MDVATEITVTIGNDSINEGHVPFRVAVLLMVENIPKFIRNYSLYEHHKSIATHFLHQRYVVEIKRKRGNIGEKEMQYCGGENLLVG